ncbi:CheB methylesterase domain-containing protein [Lentibacillus sp.]|jgi:two-component system chemotaxis response regulator CheB|uniref:CheB methylesterase domain-containing protein n=1 Tax=Lentibacillus sp. TaxID=1925746 RepID=UPI002B4AEF4A|nr:CheB methylesterase domain-containing protein [Lentibacillus sp.]HLS07654.1 CheB methylesterase domain-containing protein [Lentibacillus sp.]
MKRTPDTIVGIGASTGGPKALKQVLADLPDDFSAAILIVQHMPAGFTRSLAKRLDQAVNIRVKEATHGEIIEHHTAYLAPGDYHMKVENPGGNYTIQLTKEKQIHGQRPSVDVLFESMAYLQDVHKIVVVLTGMGADGAEGLKFLKTYHKDAAVIAESEQTSVVYGMPKAAVETSLVNQSAPVQKIGSMINTLVTMRHR